MIFRAFLEAFVYPTENEEKVREAVKTLSSAELEETVAKNHWGSRMKILSAGPDPKSLDLSPVFSGWEEERLRRLAERRMDEDGTLHLRFDKQAAFEGSLELTESSDCIKLELHTKNYPSDLEKSEQDLLSFLSQ